MYMLISNIVILLLYAKNVSFYFWFHKFYDLGTTRAVFNKVQKLYKFKASWFFSIIK